MIVNPFTGEFILNHPGHPDQSVHAGRKRVYHGTGATQDFDPEQMRSGYDTSEGIYFTADPELASMYAGVRPGARVYPAFLDLKKPKVVPRDKIGNFKKGELSEQGYDGAVSEDEEEYVVLDPRQITRGIG